MLSRFHYFAVWPGDCGPLVIRADTGVNPGIVESLGPTVTATMPTKIPALIAGLQVVQRRFMLVTVHLPSLFGNAGCCAHRRRTE